MLERGFIDFVFIGRHLFLRATIENVDLFGTKAKRGSAAVHGGKATTKNDNLFTNKGWFAIVRLGQEFDAVLDALEVSATNHFIISASQGIRDITASREID